MNAFPALSLVAGPGRLEPFFQPFTRLSDGALVGFEALARWRRLDGTIAPAADFLPDKAAWTDENAAIGRAIAAEAIDLFAAWRKTHARAQAALAINIIGADLYDGSAQRLAAQASLQGLPPAALIMELTEHHALPDLARAAETLASLRAKGVRIALDDFGTGHSSLAWLARLPTDAIKIDKSFTARIAEPGAERTIVEALVSLARAFGVETIAEGVETETQRAALAELGCGFAQGRLFSMPLPAEEAFVLAE